MGQRVRGAAIAALTMCCALSACGAEKQTQTAGATRSPAGATTVARSVTPVAKGARMVATQSRATEVLPAVAKPRSAAARDARGACRGATAEEIGARYAARAARRASKREQRFLRVIADPPRALRASPAFAVVAARVYAMSLPESDRADGFAVCARELSKKESSR